MENLNNFNDIKDVKLRNYNRAVMACNIMGDVGSVIAREYLEQFSQEERDLIFVIVSAINHLGPKKVLDQVTKGIKFSDVSKEVVVEHA